jgi:acyl-CoA dehydrogenase
LPKVASGELIMSFALTEPDVGSDAASLKTKAELDGDHYVLNGSKIWTTHAHFANKMFCLVRTNREGRPQQGITFLLLDMDLPGITVRPIHTIDDDHDLNQVFFEDVRVPVSGRLGEEDQGWGVAKYLLEFERAVAHSAGLKAALSAVIAHAGALDNGEEGALLSAPAVRRKISILAAQITAIEASEDVVMAQVARGLNPGPAASMLKIQGTETAQKVQELAVELAGDYAAVSQLAARQPGSNEAAVGSDIALTAVPRYFNGRAASIYGGSNEIQRGIISKLVLGL